jgi:hypothetical protein
MNLRKRIDIENTRLTWIRKIKRQDAACWTRPDQRWIWRVKVCVKHTTCQNTILAALRLRPWSLSISGPTNSLICFKFLVISCHPYLRPSTAVNRRVTTGRTVQYPVPYESFGSLQRDGLRTRITAPYSRMYTGTVRSPTISIKTSIFATPVVDSRYLPVLQSLIQFTQISGASIQCNAEKVRRQKVGFSIL